MTEWQKQTSLIVFSVGMQLHQLLIQHGDFNHFIVSLQNNYALTLQFWVLKKSDAHGIAEKTYPPKC